MVRLFSKKSKEAAKMPIPKPPGPPHEEAEPPEKEGDSKPVTEKDIHPEGIPVALKEEEKKFLPAPHSEEVKEIVKQEVSKPAASKFPEQHEPPKFPEPAKAEPPKEETKIEVPKEEPKEEKPAEPKKEEEPKPEQKKPAETTFKPVVEVDGPTPAPPVFIKIDKYGEIVKNIQRLKSFALGLRDALDALSDIEKELSTGLTIANRALDNFNAAITVMDAKFLRIAGTEELNEENDVPADLDHYVKNVYDQMTRLKKEISTIATP